MEHLPARPGEALIDFFMRVLNTCRATGSPVECQYVRGGKFVVTPDMDAADVVRLWFEACDADRDQALSRIGRRGARE